MKGESLGKVILDNLSAGIIILDTKGRILTLSSRAEELIDIKSIREQIYLEEILKNNYICQEGIEIKYIDSIFNELKEKNEISSLYKSIDGRTLAFKYRKISLKNEENSYIMVEVVDITTHVNMKDDLVEKIEKYSNLVVELKGKNEIIKRMKDKEEFYKIQLRTIIDNIEDGIILLDNNGKVIFHNDKIKSILEIDDIKYIETYHDKFIVRDNFGDTILVRSFIEDYIRKHIGIKEFIVNKENRLNGEMRYLELATTPIFYNTLDMIYTVVLIKDITLIKRHQKELEEKNNFIKGIVNNLEIPIGVVEYPSLYVKLGNKAFEEVMLINKVNNGNAIINNHLLDDVHVEVRRVMEKAIKKCSVEKKAFKYKPHRFIDINGEEKVHRVNYKPLMNSKNEVVSIQIYGMDVTDEVNNLNELEKINNIKDEFYTFTSHELRAPLNIICSSVQLILGIYNKEISRNVEEILNKMYLNCSRLLKIINNILDLSKAEAGFLVVKNCNFDIVNVTEDLMLATLDYAKTRDIELIFNTDMEEFPVWLDKDKYEKVLLNLLSNAIKFTPKYKKIYVTVVDEYEKIIISVRDEGVGIPEEKLNSVFDKFSQVNNGLQRSSEGTGLGLALVKKFVDMMKGEISVQSEEGIGTEFIIVLNKKYIESRGAEIENKCIESVKDKVRLEFSDV